MAKVKIQGHASGTGIFTVTAPNSSTDRTITLPDATGTLLNSDGSAASLTAIPAANITGTLPAISGASLTGVGVKVAANWRQNGNTGISSGTNYIVAKWEAIDTYGAGSIGSALTESSGIFTFPSTGIYLLNWSLYATLENDETGLRSVIAVTINNADYNDVSMGSVGIQRSSGNYELSSTAQYIVDVTNTTNVKVKFGYHAEVAPAESEIKGDTAYNQTNFLVIRLGDT